MGAGAVTGGMFGGGAGMGTAHGSIVIDTAELLRAVQTARQAGRQIEQALGGIDRGTRQAESGIARLSRSIGGLKGQLAGIGLGAGLLGGVGVRTAAGFQEAEIRLKGMLGSLAQARVLTDDLRKRAAQAGVPFADMLAVATRLLPTLQGNTQELEKWFDLTRRVAVLNQGEGMQGAAFAINEAMSSGGTDLVSLVERFNISRVALRRELATNGNDFAAALDTVLTRMGITSRTADEMGRTFNASFRAARDAALQLLAEGFAPYLDTLATILNRTREWLTQLRESGSILPRVAAGVAGIAVVGAPTLILFNQIVEAVQKLKALGLLGLLGKGGVIGGAAILGANVGLGISNAATGQNQNFGDIFETFKKLIFIVDYGVVRAFSKVAETALRLGGAFSSLMAHIFNMIPGMATVAEGHRIAAAAATSRADQMANPNGDFWTRYAGRLGLDTSAAAIPGSGSRGRGASVRSGGGGTEINQELINAQLDYQNQVASIERAAASQRLSATMQYEQQRTQAIADYEKTIARDAEDFARQRARAEAVFQRQIADVQQQAAEREADWQADLAERIADHQAAAQERITDINEDYNRERERRELDHKDRLLDAAARLDATAVFNEQKRFARESQEADEAHQQRLSREQEQLADRIQQEQESHADRLQDAREADAERIADMQESFAEQKRLEDEDRAIRLQRAAEDHADQLAQMDTAHAAQMAQIAQQEADELKAAQDAHVQQLAELGVYNKAWKEIQDARQREALKAWDQWWEQFNKRFGVQGPQPAGQYRTPINIGDPSTYPGYANGGWVNATGPAWLHQGEYVLNRRQAAGMDSRTLTIAPGAIVVNAAPGQSAEDIATVIDQHLVRRFRELAQ